MSPTGKIAAEPTNAIPMVESASEREKVGLTTGLRVAINSGWNIAGDLAPMLLAFIAIPVVIRELGPAQFGVLSIAWAVLAYTALLDLGLSRALTKLVADRIAAGSTDEITGLFWGCSLLTALAGIVGGVVLFCLSPWLARTLNLPSALYPTGRAVFHAIALTVPILVCTSALQGFIAAFQRFDLIMAARIPANAAVFLCPLVVLPFSHSLVLIVALVAVTRVTVAVVYFYYSLCLWPRLLPELQTGRNHWRALFHFGGWVLVTNTVVPLMLYCDRFLVGALVSVTAVTYYTTPYEAVTKLILIPAATARAFFPVFAEGFVLLPKRAETLLARGTNLILVLIAPLTLAVVVLAPLGMRLWLGAGFPTASTTVLRWLAVGVLVNATTQLPYTFIQAAHRPDLPAKLNLFQIPLFFCGEFVFISNWGIVGAAIVWSMRLIFESIGLWVITIWLLPEARPIAIRSLSIVGMTSVLMVLGAWLPSRISASAPFLVLALVFGLPLAWYVLLSKSERETISQCSIRYLFART